MDTEPPPNPAISAPAHLQEAVWRPDPSAPIPMDAALWLFTIALAVPLHLHRAPGTDQFPVPMLLLVGLPWVIWGMKPSSIRTLPFAALVGLLLGEAVGAAVSVPWDLLSVARTLGGVLPWISEETWRIRLLALTTAGSAWIGASRRVEARHHRGGLALAALLALVNVMVGYDDHRVADPALRERAIAQLGPSYADYAVYEISSQSLPNAVRSDVVVYSAKQRDARRIVVEWATRAKGP
jgi:hypothetical protein